MNFKDFYLHRESTSQPREISEWDSWTEWLYYFDSDILKDELLELKAKFNLQITQPIQSKIIKIEDNSDSIWMEYDSSSELFDVWAKDEDDIRQNICNLSENDLLDLAGIEEDDIYLSAHSCTLRELKENPGIVYHYTTEEKWEDIQRTKRMITSYGTGLTNRWANGIFTSSEIDEYADGTYGDVCLALNLNEFKQNNNLKELNLQLEPEVLESEIKNVILSKLDINAEEEASSDMSPYTIIVGHSIPLKYIKEIN